MDNLITLCHKCHSFITGKENEYINKYYSLLKSKKTYNVAYASHVMIGKTWLRNELSKLGDLFLTNGGDTANKRMDWDIDKSHSNDAVCITNLKPSINDVFEWLIRPIRKRSRANSKDMLGFSHHDYVQYTYLNGTIYKGYVSALYPAINALSFRCSEKYCAKIKAKKCKLLWKFSHLCWYSAAEYMPL